MSGNRDKTLTPATRPDSCYMATGPSMVCISIKSKHSFVQNMARLSNRIPQFKQDINGGIFFHNWFWPFLKHFYFWNGGLLVI